MCEPAGSQGKNKRMPEHTPTQRASAEMERAVFANPELRERFEAMAKDAEASELVPDDFSWLSHDESAEPSESDLSGRKCPAFGRVEAQCCVVLVPVRALIASNTANRELTTKALKSPS